MKRAATIGMAALVCACAKQEERALQGYGEADYIYVSSQDGGVIADVAVREGDALEAGALAFTLDPARAALSARSADASQAAARSRALNALNDAVRNAQTNHALAQTTFNRTQQLREQGFASAAQMDRDRAALQSAGAVLAQARAERDAALRDANAAGAQADLARTRLTDMRINAPIAGRVERIYHRAGEVIGPGDPVLALLAPQNMKIRFFAPETILSQLRVGQSVAIACDGCASGLTARISYIASEPQFTPPVIYSEKERAKLVFLVEARPDDPSAIRPGLPVDVTPQP